MSKRKETKGTKLAAEIRARGNKLTPEERKALIVRGLEIVKGSQTMESAIAYARENLRNGLALNVRYVVFNGRDVCTAIIKRTSGGDSFGKVEIVTKPEDIYRMVDESKETRIFA